MVHHPHRDEAWQDAFVVLRVSRVLVGVFGPPPAIPVEARLPARHGGTRALALAEAPLLLLPTDPSAFPRGREEPIGPAYPRAPARAGVAGHSPKAAPVLFYAVLHAGVGYGSCSGSGSGFGSYAHQGCDLARHRALAHLLCLVSYFSDLIN
jgi:hypothetical protein